MLQKLKRLWPWLAAIVSGLLGVACFAPFNQSWCCWIALTPLIAALWFSGENAKRPWLRNLLLGYVAGLAFFTGVFGWLGALGTLFDNFFLHVLSFLLSLYLALFFAAFSWLTGLLRPREKIAQPVTTKWDEMLARAGKPMADTPPSGWLRSTTNLRVAFCLAAGWTALEWTRGWLFGGFGWNGLGVALHNNLLIIQIAEFTGVAGISFVIVFANVIAVAFARRLILETQAHRMRPHYDFILTMLLIVGLLSYGLHVWQNKVPAASIRVAAVQPNIAQRQKFDPQSAPRVFDQFARLSEIALRTNPPPDLLVWPEAAMPEPVRDENGESYRFVMDFAASTKTDLLLGTDDVDQGLPYNAALLVSNGGEQMQIYHKIHLVPFGEYIPLRNSFPPFAAIAGKWVPGDFDFGKDHTVFRLTNGDVQVAPLICFEDTIGDLVRQFVRNGANLLVDVTNDGWFLRSAGSQQHLASAIFRCVETRRPMVRAANTGVTCFINEFGRVTQMLQDENGGTFTEGVLTGDVDVPTEQTLTFYARHGELFAQLCACLALVTGVVEFTLMFWRKRSSRKIAT